MKEALDILILIVIANAAPVITSFIFSEQKLQPIDFGLKLKDEQALFGKSKTWSGLISSLILTSFCAYVLNYDISSGLIISTLAMAGDLISSFIKRRFKQKSSETCILLDQIPESVFPALAMKIIYSLSMIQVIAIVVSFIIIELILSAILLRYRRRKRQMINTR